MSKSFAESFVIGMDLAMANLISSCFAKAYAITDSPFANRVIDGFLLLYLQDAFIRPSFVSDFSSSDVKNFVYWGLMQSTKFYSNLAAKELLQPIMPIFPKNVKKPLDTLISVFCGMFVFFAVGAIEETLIPLNFKWAFSFALLLTSFHILDHRKAKIQGKVFSFNMMNWGVAGIILSFLLMDVCILLRLRASDIYLSIAFSLPTGAMGSLALALITKPSSPALSEFAVDFFKFCGFGLAKGLVVKINSEVSSWLQK